MILNLGNKGMEAAKMLRFNPDWIAFCDALEGAARASLHRALESPVESRVDSTAYARGLCELHMTLHALMTDGNMRAPEKLSLTDRKKVTVDA